MQNNLSSRVLKTAPIDWKSLKFIQQPNFKDISQEDMQAIKTSLLVNNFAQPFYVWKDEKQGDLYCLDGKHRTLALEELEREGHNIPKTLPATYIQCQDKKQAAQLVVIYSSIYAKVSQQGLFDFLQAYEIEMNHIKEQISLPEFSIPRFEQKFDTNGINQYQEQAYNTIDQQHQEDQQIIVKKGDLFQLDHHKIICGDFACTQTTQTLMGKEKARIVTCDPPYNLSADFIGNTKEDKHENFAMAHGEMSDQEFVDFIAQIMQQSTKHTVDGAIHYIFMDFRHTWHMGEAAKNVYGNPAPKQMVVWAKDMMALGSFYRAQHELCFIYKSGKARHLSNLELMNRIRSNVWSYPSGISTANPDREEIQNHPTPKPVAMIADTLLDTTMENDIVIDWFLGSGTALIASEITGRQFRGTEIEPRYIQLSIQRYIKHCQKQGKTPHLKHLNGTLTLKDFE